jgi:Ca2+-binding EF-hand superfamily protein
MIRRISLVALALSALTSCHSNKSRQMDTREKLIAGFTALLKSWDKDRDGRLSRSEVETMVNESFRRMARSIPAGEAHPELEPQRQQAIDHYMAQDTNRDGYLSLNELLREPLANFDCTDADHDGKLSQSEFNSSIARCAPHHVEGQPLQPVQ